jgi:hypothetical protein
MGTLFMVNPPKRKSRKRRTAKQRAATRKLVALNKRKRRAASPKKRRRRTTTTRSKPMARKRRRRTTAKRAAPRRRRRTAVKRRSPVTKLRRHSIYLTNPRRRRRYRSNPQAIVKTLQQGAMDAGATLVGGAVGRIAAGFVPVQQTGLTGVAVQLGVAVAVGFVSRNFVAADTARFITAGAMQVPIKNLITTFVPQAGAFLGDYDNIASYEIGGGNGMGNYLSPGMYGYSESEDVEIGVYE